VQDLEGYKCAIYVSFFRLFPSDVRVTVRRLAIVSYYSNPTLMVILRNPLGHSCTIAIRFFALIAILLGLLLDDSKAGDVTAIFNIAASAGANGTISPSGIVLVNNGANQTYTIVAA
jgi:hypothetical protein